MASAGLHFRAQDEPTVSVHNEAPDDRYVFAAISCGDVAIYLPHGRAASVACARRLIGALTTVIDQLQAEPSAAHSLLQQTGDPR